MNYNLKIEGSATKFRPADFDRAASQYGCPTHDFQEWRLPYLAWVDANLSRIKIARRDKILGLFGWMVGYTREWNDTLSSNFTFAENRLNNTPLQRGDEVHKTTYLSANLLSQPLERVTVGVEYLSSWASTVALRR